MCSIAPINPELVGDRTQPPQHLVIMFKQVGKIQFSGTVKFVVQIVGFEETRKDVLLNQRLLIVGKRKPVIPVSVCGFFG